MNPKKNKTFISVVVWIMVVGLVGAYAPLLFQKPPIVDESYYPPPPTASLAPPEPALPTSTPPLAPLSEKISPDGFSGLNEEGQSIEDLEGLLGN